MCCGNDNTTNNISLFVISRPIRECFIQLETYPIVGGVSCMTRAFRLFGSIRKICDSSDVERLVKEVSQHVLKVLTGPPGSREEPVTSPL